MLRKGVLHCPVWAGDKMAGVANIERPLDGLNQAKGQRIIIELKNKKQIVGKLITFDIHTNLVVDDAEEREDGEIKRKIGRAFIRGDMVVFVSMQ